MVCANKDCPTYSEVKPTGCVILGMNDNMRMLCKDFISLQTANTSVSAGATLLGVQVKNLFKELDEKHHLAETDYLRTKSKFDHGRAVALGEACSKLMLVLNEYH